MIEVKNLTKKYGSYTAVNNISFTVEKGRIYGFLGPNGAGKSTTMNIICGCLAATDGEVIINGHDIYDEPREARRFIGYLPETPPLYTDMTPKEYLTFVARAKKIPTDRLSLSVEEVMERTGLTKMANRIIRNLSKGYKQRVGIAQAILGDPEIIILDEPTVGLDPMQIIEIRDLIRELGKDHTVILSSHVLSEISATCDYVIMIAHGQIVAADTLENLNRTFSGTEIITIETKGDAGAVKACLDGIDKIASVDIVDSPIGTSCRIEVEEGADIREELFIAFAEKGIALLSMQSNSQSLEDIFIRLVNEEHLDVSGGDVEDDSEAQSETDDSAETESGYSPYYSDAPKNEEPSEEEEEYKPLFGGSEEE